MAHKELHPVALAAAGAAIGLAAGATAVAFSDEKNRRKVVRKFNEVKITSQKTLDDFRKKS